jgi:hypothetical protein
MGQFVRMREYPNASFKDVTAPNADTLYTQAWFDVSKEPWVISVPDMKGRYYLLPMLDGWTTVFDVPGKRTAPKDKFILMMRLYWPKEKAPSMIDGSWKIPPVNQAADTSADKGDKAGGKK